jgi:hypothetical protein
VNVLNVLWQRFQESQSDGELIASLNNLVAEIVVHFAHDCTAKNDEFRVYVNRSVSTPKKIISFSTKSSFFPPNFLPKISKYPSIFPSKFLSKLTDLPGN